ncbi:MAG: hypothetical protein V3Q69_03510 [Burkholderia sp.]
MFKQSRRTIVTDAQMALYQRDRGTAVLDSDLDGLVIIESDSTPPSLISVSVEPSTPSPGCPRAGPLYIDPQFVILILKLAHLAHMGVVA